MTKPLFDQEIHEERRSRPAPLGEWMRVCRLKNQLKAVDLKLERWQVCVNKLVSKAIPAADQSDAQQKYQTRVINVTRARDAAAKERQDLSDKAATIMHKAFKDWGCEVMVLLNKEGAQVETYWSWPQQRRVFTFSFSDPLSVKEE